MGVNQEQSCGCAAEPRRICDVCHAPPQVFLACSVACLRRHQEQAHGPTLAPEAATRARSFVSAYNRRFPDNWQRYAPQRQRLMDWVGDTRAAAIAIFGAGNGSDIDLERLSRSFQRLHLVDLDGEALERTRERQTEKVRERLVLHADVDLSGFLQHLDDWGERFPEPGELGRSAVAAARAIIARLGQTFDVVLSTCVLSQLVLPYHQSWVAPRQQWANLVTAITAVHLATVAGSVAAAGRGLIAFDVLSSRQLPALAERLDASADELASFVASERAAGGVALQPEPESLVQQLRAPGLASLVAEPRLLSPWLWELGDATQLVYGLEFRNPRA